MGFKKHRTEAQEWKQPYVGGGVAAASPLHHPPGRARALTLVLLSMAVFALAQVLPGDVGRAVLGPYAGQDQVDLLNHQLGVDRPIVVQYRELDLELLARRHGQSLQYQVPVWDLLKPALVNSLKLAPRRSCIVVPLGILGGIWRRCGAAALTDRMITVAGLSLTAVPGVRHRRSS